MVIPQVAQYLNLGTIDAMTTIIPTTEGKKQFKQIGEIKNTIFSFTLFIALFVFSVVILYVLFFSPYNITINLFICYAGFLVVMWQIKKYFVTLYAASNNFRLVSLFELSFTILVTTLQLIFIILMGEHGFWLGFIIPNLIVIIYIVRHSIQGRLWNGPRISLLNLQKIVPVGISMMIVAVTYLPFMILARLFLAKTAEMTEVGYFILPMIIIGKISIVPSAIGQVILPRISLHHAQTNNIQSSFNLFVKSQLYSLFITLAIIFTGILFLEPLVTIIMPKYIEGVQPAKMILLAGIPYCLIDNANNFILVLQYKRVYVVNLMITILFQIVIFIYLATTGNISAYAIATSLILVFVFYAFLINIRVIKIYNKSLIQEFITQKSVNKSNVEFNIVKEEL